MRSVSQLHALLRDLVAGGAPAALTAVGAAALLRKIRPATAVQRACKHLAWDLVREIRTLDAELESITERMVEALEAHPTRLVDIDGVGPVLAARLIGRCGRASRFPTADAFARYAGVVEDVGHVCRRWRGQPWPGRFGHDEMRVPGPLRVVVLQASLDRCVGDGIEAERVWPLGHADRAVVVVDVFDEQLAEASSPAFSVAGNTDSAVRTTASGPPRGAGSSRWHRAGRLPVAVAGSGPSNQPQAAICHA